MPTFKSQSDFFYQVKNVSFNHLFAYSLNNASSQACTPVEMYQLIIHLNPSNVSVNSQSLNTGALG